MTQAITQNINSIYKYKEKIFIFLVVAIFTSIFAYLFLLHKAIANVVVRESVIKENRELTNTVNDLEAKYFSVKNTIDIEMAHEKGFKDPEVTAFISKKSLTAMANHNEL